jgi:hypothetical protein
MQNHSRTMRHNSTILAFVCLLTAGIKAPAEDLPPGLTDSDPMVRLVAVQEVGRNKIRNAEDVVAKMAKEDTFAGVREAACKALQDFGAVWQIDHLSEIAANDPEVSVRNAAATAIQALERQLKNDTSLPRTAEEDERYRMPTMSLDDKEPKTRLLAVGIGIMGGYGFAAAHLRGRIPTGFKYLPWIGIEAGAGWTPPALYVVTAGPVGDVNGDDKWKIISGAGGVLLYPHRMHYATVRGGFDIGRGGYALIGYGLEVLNDEGFVSWGVEAGIVIQPAIENMVDNISVCSEGDPDCHGDLWPVIPYTRFSIHFYPL